jgi:hypothetical protein
LIRADIDYLPSMVGLGRNTAAQAAFGLLLLFPFSLLLWCVLPVRLRRITPFVVTLFVCIVQVVYHLQVGQPVGMGAVVFSIVIASGSYGILKVFLQ